MLTAQQIWEQLDFYPSHIKVYVEGHDDESAEANAAAVAKLTAWRIPQLAHSEVAAPVKAVCGEYGFPLPSSVLATYYPSMNADGRAAEAAELQDLFDSAVISFAGWHINKRINSSNDEYDEDADEWRASGNQQVKKLVERLTPIVAKAQAAATPAASASQIPPSRSRRVRRVW